VIRKILRVKLPGLVSLDKFFGESVSLEMDGTFGGASEVVDESDAFSADELRPNGGQIFSLWVGSGGEADLHGD